MQEKIKFTEVSELDVEVQAHRIDCRPAPKKRVVDGYVVRFVCGPGTNGIPPLDQDEVSFEFELPGRVIQCFGVLSHFHFSTGAPPCFISGTIHCKDLPTCTKRVNEPLPRQHRPYPGETDDEYRRRT